MAAAGANSATAGFLRRTIHQVAMHLLHRMRIVFLIALLLSTASAQTPDPFNAIASALQDQAFATALELLRPALQRSPGDPRLWAMQGTALAGTGDFHAALASFHQALGIAPGYLPALRGAAQIDYDQANTAGIPLLQHILRLRPGDSTAHGMLAVLEYQQGNCAAASIHFAAAAAVFASRPPALHAWAACLVKLGQYDKAARILQQSLALNPDDLRERQGLAAVDLMAQHPRDALEVLAPLTDHPDAITLDLASRAYELSHDTEQAAGALRQAIQLDPRNVNLYLEFAVLAANHHALQAGLDVVNSGISLQPRAAPLYFARGMLNIQLNEYEKAQADFETAYNLDPTQSLSAAAQGLAAIQQNDLTRAAADVQQKLARNPNDPVLLYIEADVLSLEGAAPGSPEFHQALRAAQRAVALRPGLAPARSVLAKLDLRAGRSQDAALQCRKALAIDPNDQTAVYRLILALRSTDQKSEIPGLLQRLAQLRVQSTQNNQEQVRHALAGDAPPP